MTVAANDAYQQSTATGGEASFPYDFPITADADIVVQVDGVTLTLTTDYTVTGAGGASGTIVLDTGVYPSGATAGTVWTRYRDVPVTRPTNFTTAGDFLAAAVNTQLDRLTLIAQDLKERVRRAALFTQADNTKDVALPTLVASKLLGVNSAGTGFALYAQASISDTIIPSAFMETLLDDTDAATARATLELEPGVDVQAYDADIPTVAASQAEMEAGTETAVRAMSPLRVAQAISALGASSPNVAIGSFTRDISTASGNQAVTGVGFEPTHGIFLAAEGNTNKMSIGFSDGTSNYALNDRHSVTADTWSVANADAISVFQGGGNAYAGDVNSWDSDGFTIAWTKTGTTTGTITIFYFVIG